NAPWLLFEAGGLSKGLTKARVCPLLVDLESKDLGPPLSQFNHTLPDREDMWKLIKTINAAGAENALDQRRLEGAFAQWWPDLEKAFKEIRTKYKTTARPQVRSTDDMIVEILEISRAVQRSVKELNPPGFTGSAIGPL